MHRLLAYSAYVYNTAMGAAFQAAPRSKYVRTYVHVALRHVVIAELEAGS